MCALGRGPILGLLGRDTEEMAINVKSRNENPYIIPDHLPWSVNFIVGTKEEEIRK